MELANQSNFRDLPIVLSDSGCFVEIWHYAPAIFRRAVTLPNPECAVTYAGIDTVDKLVLALRPYAPLASRISPASAPRTQGFSSIPMAHGLTGWSFA
jgi:hypothetical protein